MCSLCSRWMMRWCNNAYIHGVSETSEESNGLGGSSSSSSVGTIRSSNSGGSAMGEAAAKRSGCMGVKGMPRGVSAMLVLGAWGVSAT